MGVCESCGRRGQDVASRLGVCADCIRADTSAARLRTQQAHARSREEFGLPARPPRDPKGVACTLCVNACQIGRKELGFCGVRSNKRGRLVGGDADGAAVSWYHDPLPTNCVADWVCPASTGAGYPEFTDTEHAEQGYTNLAVFYEACSFNCLFCQNWQFKRKSLKGERHTAAELAEAVTPLTRCMCHFGGDPSCQIEHALAASRLAIEKRGDGILRICWETNGSMAGAHVRQMAELSLASGGCVKFDLKAWDESLHRALCGVGNRRTLHNVEHVVSLLNRRPDPPLLVASTLLVPGYVDPGQVGQIARFLARLDPSIPYALLAFHPDFQLYDLPVTSKRQASDCLHAAQDQGLTRVRLGNRHLLV